MELRFLSPCGAADNAGARAVRRDVRVLATERTTEIFAAAYDNPLGARSAAEEQYREGADIIFHAAGKSGIGLLEAARDQSGPDRQLWAIGADTDQYQTVAAIPGVVDSASLRRHILTSVL